MKISQTSTAFFATVSILLYLTNFIDIGISIDKIGAVNPLQAASARQQNVIYYGQYCAFIDHIKKTNGSLRR